jgi:hypothetical protein
MKTFKDLDKSQQQFIRSTVIKENTEIAGFGLLGFNVKKLAPSKKNKEKFDQDFTGHPLCGCVGCMELAKIFIDKAPDIQEEIHIESAKDIETLKIK